MIGPAASVKITALGDSRRREIFEILARGPLSVAGIAAQLPVTRPAVSQHLKVLRDAGLVTSRTEGTRHMYQLDASGIAALRDYFDSLWRHALDDFKRAAEQSYAQRQKQEKV